MPRDSAYRSTQLAIANLLCILWPVCGVAVYDERLVVAYQLSILLIAMLIILRGTKIGKANLCEQNVLIAVTVFEPESKRATIPNHLDADECTHVGQHGFSIMPQESITVEKSP